MNLSWTSQTHCGAPAPLKCWQETHPECQFWAVYGGKMRSDGPSRVGTFFGRAHPPATLSCVWSDSCSCESQSQTQSGELRQLKADFPWAGSAGLCLSSCLSWRGRQGRAALGTVCLYCCKPSTAILKNPAQGLPADTPIKMRTAKTEGMSKNYVWEGN